MRNPFKKGRLEPGTPENLGDRNGAFEYGKLAITSLITTAAGAFVAILAFVGQAKALPPAPADQLFLGLLLVGGALALAFTCSILAYINQALLAFSGERPFVWYLAIVAGLVSLVMLVSGGVEACVAVRSIVTAPARAEPSVPSQLASKPKTEVGNCHRFDPVCFGDQHEGAGAWFAGFAALMAGGLTFWIGRKQVIAAQQQLREAIVEATAARKATNGAVVAQSRRLTLALSHEVARIKMIANMQLRTAGSMWQQDDEKINFVIAESSAFRITPSPVLRDALGERELVTSDVWNDTVALASAVDQLNAIMDVRGRWNTASGAEVIAAIRKILQAGDDVQRAIGLSEHGR